MFYLLFLAIIIMYAIFFVFFSVLWCIATCAAVVYIWDDLDNFFFCFSCFLMCVFCRSFYAVAFVRWFSCTYSAFCVCAFEEGWWRTMFLMPKWIVLLNYQWIIVIDYGNEFSLCVSVKIFGFFLLKKCLDYFEYGRYFRFLGFFTY